MIGLIFGETKFPIKILKKVKKKYLRYLIIDLTGKKKFKKENNSYAVSIGQVGKILKILKENKCKKVLFAGKVKKPIFSRLKLDFKGIYYIPRIIRNSKLGDAAILKEIIKILKQEKIKTISSLTFNSELTLKKGTYSKTKPNRKDKIDIKKGVVTREFIYSNETYERLRLNDTSVEKENSNTKSISKVGGQIISEISGYPPFYTQMIFDTFDKTVKIKSVLDNTEGISVLSKCEKIIKYKLES